MTKTLGPTLTVGRARVCACPVSRSDRGRLVAFATFWGVLVALSACGSKPAPCLTQACGQVCSDQQFISSCDLPPPHDCYKGATCERQADGTCGFTSTPSLKACLSADGGTTCPWPQDAGFTSPDGGTIPFSHPSPCDCTRQGCYEYPGCQNTKAYCPRDATFGCAMDSIWSKHRACTVDGDCVFVQVSNCVGYGSCIPISVADAGRDAFLAEASAESARYCADAGCGESGQCARDAGGIRPFCYQGLCGWR